MANYMTSSQRYNARMDKIWENAMAIKRKNCNHKFQETRNIWTNRKMKVCEYCGETTGVL